MSRGRPRAFDIDEALENAICVFWQKGYEGASLQDLTEAMGINRPSLYAAFGNKEQLFRRALDRYIGKSETCFREIMNGPDLRAGMEESLRMVADQNTDDDEPRGCLLIGALSCGEEAEPIKEELMARRAASEKWLRDHFSRARKKGDLPADTDAPGLARFYSAVMQGMAVQAASGASRKALQSIIDHAMKAWPA
jgi:AcrR family transcriptional regulator